MTAPCAHWRTPVGVAGGTVRCSGWLARPAELDGYVARAFYLDAAWRTAASDDVHGVTIVDWPDFGVIEPDALRQLADDAVAGLERSPVDIGCLGGHGRTGTLLAAIIGRGEGLGADEAIAAARERYCAHAVETQGQAALLRAALENGPAKP